MRSSFLKISAVIALVVLTSLTPAAQRTNGDGANIGPAFQSIGPLAFGPDGVLFAADTQGASIFALKLGSQAGAVAGAKDLPAVDQKIAALLGTDVREISVTDMLVHPQSRNAYITVMRGQGSGSMPVLVRADGAGKLEVIDLSKVAYTKVALPNPATGTAARGGRTESITDMAYMDGRLYVAGLSNEEFASKLRSVPYPFTSTADNGTSVEIFHGNHGQFETRSPVYTFLPYTVNNTPHLIASYLCTPLVKFPLSSLTPGAKVMGTTIAELGNRNRPLDMILYHKNGKEFLLMSNNSRGVMKIPTTDFGSAAPITTRVEGETGGVAYETVASMKGIEQLDLLDERTSLVLARADTGSLSLQAVALP